MEWAIGLPIVLFALLCPLMMVGMIVGGWIFGRKAMGDHGMMCMGHGGHGHDAGRTGQADERLLEELKAERERLDGLIVRAEREGLH